MKDAAFALPLALLAAPIPADEVLKSGRDLLREAEAQITHIDTPTLQQRLKEEPSRTCARRTRCAGWAAPSTHRVPRQSHSPSLA